MWPEEFHFGSVGTLPFVISIENQASNKNKRPVNECVGRMCLFELKAEFRLDDMKSIVVC